MIPERDRIPLYVVAAAVGLLLGTVGGGLLAVVVARLLIASGSQGQASSLQGQLFLSLTIAPLVLGSVAGAFAGPMVLRHWFRRSPLR